MSERYRRWAMEFITITGFLVAILTIPSSEWRWFFAGATATGLVTLGLLERKLVEGEDRYAELHKQFDALAIFNDPELMAIQREDERERRRIEREAVESDHKMADEMRKKFLREI